MSTSDLQQRVGGRARGEVDPPGAELAALRRPRPVLPLLLRQQSGEQRLDRRRVVGHARPAQVRPAGLLARRGIDAGEPGALGFSAAISAACAVASSRMPRNCMRTTAGMAPTWMS